MIIAVYSDIHENFHNLRACLTLFKEKNVQEALFLGDFCHPGILKEMIATGIRTHCIWGNNDGEVAGITQMIAGTDGLFTISTQRSDIIERDGRKVALLHHPDFAESLAKSGDFDAVFYGHDHKKHFEMVGECVLANPGEISAQVTGTASYLLWDTKKNEVEMIEIENPLNTKS